MSTSIVIPRCGYPQCEGKSVEYGTHFVDVSFCKEKGHRAHLHCAIKFDLGLLEAAKTTKDFTKAQGCPQCGKNLIWLLPITLTESQRKIFWEDPDYKRWSELREKIFSAPMVCDAVAKLGLSF